MKSKMIVVGGASGAVGEGLVAHLLSKGNSVIAVLRTQLKIDELHQFLKEANISAENLICIVNGFASEEEISQLQKELAKYPIEVAIASLGGWYHGNKLSEVPLSDLHGVIDSGLTSHLRFAKAVLPLLQKQSKANFIMINGGAAEYVVQHSGIISIVAASQKMMAQVLAQELQHSTVHVHSVAAFDMVKTRQRGNDGQLWLTPAKIADYILALVDSNTSQPVWHKLQTPQDLSRLTQADETTV